MRRDAASERQVQAADPAASTWLSANAGSGKTRVLTDRVARLLLAGTEPQRILCLTYTKAAASEMQNRLFRRLGGWAMLADGALRAELETLGAGGPVGEDTLRDARRLFARAIETPGGLRIQTIHSFCAALLRRFPLEAGVAPGFAEMDDRTAALARAEIVEEMAQDAPEVVGALAALYTGEDFAGLTEEIARNRAGFAAPLDHAGAMAAFGLGAGVTPETVLRGVFAGGEAGLVAQVAGAMAAGSVTDARNAEKLMALVPALRAPDLATLAGLETVLLSGAKAKTPFAARIGSLPTRATQAALGPLLEPFNEFMRRVEIAREERVALTAAGRALALHRFAARFLPAYEARKAARGWLDFDDLILKARQLLTDPSVAQWVLYRLDGGIDHILIDEAQDTGPEQWKVIELLAQEFTAGEGARGSGRTIFVVGDKKQSIYSFQGADLRKFEAMQRHFDTNLAESGHALRDLVLEHSFRSSPAILKAVDLTFDERTGADLAGTVKHIAFHDGMPGRVDLWPAIEPAEDPDPGDWSDPVDLPAPRHHAVELAETVAAEIARMIATGTRLPGTDRALRAGDVLILVQRRSTLFHEIIRACKAAGLPIAGADRLRLGGELAVKDLAALLSFLATPEDDLSLAAALRSPLFGWSEGQLYGLAHGRDGWLWQALRGRAGEFAPTHAVLADLRDHADFLRPYELIERMLTRHGGRHRLIARLGQEAEDGIDQLLAQALAYERLEVPSLTGFLGWLKTDDIEVRRQADSAGDRIRVMTVHGAKGLEAPVVILPDTADRRVVERGEILTLPGGLPVWRTPADDSPAAIAGAREAAREAREAEGLRLLYVAMTRAEYWLIAAAAGKVETPEAWHNRIRAGLAAAGAEALDTPTGPGLRLAHGAWPEPAAAPAPVQETRPSLPGWALAPAPEVVRPVPLLSPSDLGGTKALPGEGALDEDAAKRRGTALHLLLEHLPGAEDRAALAERLLGAEGAALLPEAAAVLDAPELAPLFAPGTLAEVPVTAEIAGRRMLGVIDRLVVEPGRVLAVDYKSNAVVPGTPAQAPEGLLRQMGAYAAALAAIYPGRRIETAILWTRVARLMPLPAGLTAAALARAEPPPV